MNTVKQLSIFASILVLASPSLVASQMQEPKTERSTAGILTPRRVAAAGATLATAGGAAYLWSRLSDDQKATLKKKLVDNKKCAIATGLVIGTGMTVYGISSYLTSNVQSGPAVLAISNEEKAALKGCSWKDHMHILLTRKWKNHSAQSIYDYIFTMKDPFGLVSREFVNFATVGDLIELLEVCNVFMAEDATRVSDARYKAQMDKLITIIGTQTT